MADCLTEVLLGVLKVDDATEVQHYTTEVHCMKSIIKTKGNFLNSNLKNPSPTDIRNLLNSKFVDISRPNENIEIKNQQLQ